MAYHILSHVNSHSKTKVAREFAGGNQAYVVTRMHTIPHLTWVVPTYLLESFKTYLLNSLGCLTRQINTSFEASYVNLHMVS
jgi:hypothetical protein